MGGVARIRGLSVEVDKNSLMERLEGNKKKHKEIYAKATKEWKSQIKKTAKKIADCDDDKVLKTLLIDFRELDRPEDYSGAYEKALGMLQAHTGASLELDHDLFERLWNDNWEWRRAFNLSTSKYLG